MNMLRTLALLLLAFTSPALAQWQVPAGNVPIGRGTGVTGFNSIAPGANNTCLVSSGGAWVVLPCVTNATSLTPGADNNCVVTSGGTWVMMPCSTPVGGAYVYNATTRTVLKALDTNTIKQAFLGEGARSGPFKWTLGNYTAAIAADTNEGVYIKADAVAANVGAWVRQFDFTNFQTQWFGAPADYVTDSTAIINSMMVVANIQNTLTTPGVQTAVYINVQGGVKFASQNLQWLSASNWVYVNVRFFHNSDTTKGVSTGGGGTNEVQTLGVNSGAPGDPTGALVDEDIRSAPLHVARGVNLQKNIDNSIFVHSGSTQSVQPNDSLNAATASEAYIRDENLDRFRLSYNRFGTNSYFNGINLIFNNRQTNLVCTGCNGAGAWGGSIPAVGAVVRGVTTLSRYVVTSLATPDILQTDWLSGTAIPGEFLMNERAIFKGSITGNVLTVTQVLQGAGNIANGHRIAGMYLNNGITAATNITAVAPTVACNGLACTGAGGVGTYALNNSQTIPATEMVAGNVAANGILGGGVGNIDTTYNPIRIGMRGDFIFTRNTVANLTGCVSAYEGAVSVVTDSNTAVWGANIAAGGANRVMVYCNGTNWTVMGK